MAATFTFDADAPGATARDRVRMLIGATVKPALEFVSDQEIEHVTDSETNDLSAAVQILDNVIARLAYDLDRDVAGINEIRSTRHQRLIEVRDRLKRKQSAHAGSAIEVGNLSYDERTSIESDADYREPAFKRDMGDRW